MTTMSVIIPTRNRPESLARTVASLLEQTRLPDEIVIVNDGAEEMPSGLGQSITSAGVALEYCEFRTARPSASASRNRGMDLASGQILVMIDDDMVPGPDCLGALIALYDRAPPGAVAAIGARPVEPPPKNRFGRWLWSVLAEILGQTRWVPRVCAARYAALPPSLRAELTPGKAMAGGLMSVRRRVAAEYRFDDEFFCGYVVGEDRDFSFRLALDRPVFLAENITVLHDPHPGGRPNRFMLGRMIVSSTLHTAGCCGDRGAGAFVLLCHQFAGTFLLHAVWGLARRQKSNLLYAAGIAVEVFSRLGKRIASIVWA
ncbi:MAG: glycosyltransferase family 2 protein [Planctomycetes bacterium]|nr:glycosyltransferase family 2 protein [Planctomycetota bacterium]